MYGMAKKHIKVEGSVKQHPAAWVTWNGALGLSEVKPAILALSLSTGAPASRRVHLLVKNIFLCSVFSLLGYNIFLIVTSLLNVGHKQKYADPADFPGTVLISASTHPTWVGSQ